MGLDGLFATAGVATITMIAVGLLAWLLSLYVLYAVIWRGVKRGLSEHQREMQRERDRAIAHDHAMSSR